MTIQTYIIKEGIVQKLHEDSSNGGPIAGPVVYLLENQQEVYVGQTNSIERRIKEHLKKTKKQRLTRVHIITDEEFHTSAITDIESQLIQYLAADKKFILQNGNEGQLNLPYYDRERYTAKFETIWRELQNKDLARGQLEVLRHTAVFKFSPYKPLTPEQKAVAIEIKTALRNNPQSVHIVSGEPGTGKSVLAIHLLENIKHNSLHSTPNCTTHVSEW